MNEFSNFRNNDDLDSNKFQIDSLNIDLNQLFNLSYSFDTLKLTLNGIMKNQLSLADKINDIEDQIKKGNNKKNRQLSGIDKRLGNIELRVFKKRMGNIRDYDNDITNDSSQYNTRPGDDRYESGENEDNDDKKKERRNKPKKNNIEEGNNKETSDKTETELNNINNNINKETGVGSFGNKKNINDGKDNINDDIKDKDKENGRVNENNNKDNNENNNNNNDNNENGNGNVNKDNGDLDNQNNENNIDNGNYENPYENGDTEEEKNNDWEDYNQYKKSGENGKNKGFNYIKKKKKKPNRFKNGIVYKEEDEDGLNNNSLSDNGNLAATEELYSRLNDLEKKFQNLELSTQKFIQSQEKEKRAAPKDEIQLQKIRLDNLQTDLDDMIKKNKELEKKVDDMAVKVNDFNIYDLFKDCTLSDGSIDVGKLLVKNLEQKVFKKFDVIDDRNHHLEEDIFKLGKEFQNIKNQSDLIQRSYDGFKDNIGEILESIDRNNNELNQKINENANKINENHKKVLDKIELERKESKEKYEKIKNNMKNLSIKNDDFDEGNKIEGQGGMNEKDLKVLKDFNKRLNELDLQLQSYIGTVNIEKIREEIGDIIKELNLKANEADLVNAVHNLNIEKAKNENLKDTVDRNSEMCKKNMNDVSFLMRKVESMNATILAFRNILESGTLGSSHFFDNSKFVSSAAFNDFIKKDSEDKEKISKEFDEIRRLIDEITVKMGDLVSVQDLKNFEAIFNNKIEELKLQFSRKFADKIDTNKSLRYLETQIRHIIDTYIKKLDKGESWLLAKKPVGGYMCASCEAYIGEQLKEQGDFLAWNKYPQRDKEKGYRIGNGFSRMLGMLNIDTRNAYNEEKEYESDNEIRNYRNDVKRPHISSSVDMKPGTSKSKVLPKILVTSKMDEINTANMNNNSFADPSERVINSVNKDESAPHVVKIFRKNKN